MPRDAARIGKDMAFSVKILTDTTLALDERVCADMRRLAPDCIVADSMAVWGKAAALKLGIPFVSSTTTFAFNRHSAKIMQQSPGGLLKMIFSMPGMNKQVRRLREKGYPVKNVLDIIQNDEDTHTVVYTSPEFQPCSETFSDRYAFVGPLVRPPRERIKKIREKLVYVSMGTVNNDLLPLYKRCVSALAQLDCQVILSVGDRVRPDALGPLPEHITAFAQVDQIAVLEQADAFISHCGMNSAGESLYFGVPLIGLPQTPEQAGVARRVKELGAGILPADTEEKTLREAVRKMLTDAAYRENALKIAEGFHRCSGAKGAADKIEQVCDRNMQ